MREIVFAKKKKGIYDLILLDAYNIAFRNYWKLNQLRTSDGVLSGIIFGYNRLIKGLKDKYYGAKIYVLWDARKSKLARRKIDPQYKANRIKKELPYFFEQIDDTKKLLSYMGVSQFICDKAEADDLANYFVNKKRDRKILLVSGDKDWIQMMNDKVDIFFNGEVYNIDEIKTKLDIDFETLKLEKIVFGDSSDNVPSVVKRFPKAKFKSILKELRKEKLRDFILYVKANSKDKWCAKIVENFDRLNMNEKLISFVDKEIIRDNIETIEKDSDENKKTEILYKYQIRG